MKKLALVLLVAVLLTFFSVVSLSILPVQAEDTAIALISQEVHNKFPEGMEFEVVAETTPEAQIKEIKLEMKLVGSQRSSYTYLEFTSDTRVDGKYLLHTNGAQYKPSGISVEYRFIITDSAGRTKETAKETYLYLDNRVQWQKVADGQVEVYYYGPVKTRAELVLKASTGTLTNMGGVLGVTASNTIRVIGYNDPSQMAIALPFQSKTSQTELLTQGMAFYEYGVLLEFIGDPRADGVASHELTHMLVREATKESFVNLPVWLNEGLAEYANINMDDSHTAALKQAISTQQVLTLRHMQAMPGKPEDIILFYGQAHSVVTYLVDKYGAEKLRALFAAFKQGAQIDDALKKVYGFDQDGLDNAWRRSVNLPEVKPAATQPASRWQFGCASSPAK